MLGFAQSDAYPTAQLATAAINMAAAVRGGDVAGVIFHTDKGSQYMGIPPNRGDIVYEETLCHTHDASTTRSSRAGAVRIVRETRRAGR